MTRSKLKQLFKSSFPIIGMVHLEPLPGSPRYGGSMASVFEAAEQDALALKSGGAAAILIENFGDAPFYPDRVPAETIAAMGVVARQIRLRVDLPMGINVLRNDGYAAMAIAAAVGAQFIRVNILAGAVVTDQGLLQGKAHEILRLRKSLDANVKIFADIRVKHSSPLGAIEVEQEAAELLDRALADAIICTGAMTGSAIDLAVLRRLRDSLPEVAILAGSGVRPDNVRDIFQFADAAIVGTAIKGEEIVTHRVDLQKVEKLTKTLNH